MARGRVGDRGERVSTRRRGGAEKNAEGKEEKRRQSEACEGGSQVRDCGAPVESRRAQAKACGYLIK
jgi:hypothetical protein